MLSNTVKFSKALFKGRIFRGAYIRRGLSTEENLRFKIDRASLIVGSKFKVFALFYFVFEGNFPSTRRWGAYIWRGDLMGGFLRYRFGRLIFGGAYTWKGLFSEFYGIICDLNTTMGYSKHELFVLFYFIASKKQRRKKITQTKLKEKKIPRNK